jgi:hypothetical protein
MNAVFAVGDRVVIDRPGIDHRREGVVAVVHDYTDSAALVADITGPDLCLYDVDLPGRRVRPTVAGRGAAALRRDARGGAGMSTLALVVPADPAAEMRYVLIPPAGLERLQQLVGGLIEGIPAQHEQLAAWCNEEGRLRGLPVNSRATAWWQRHGYDADHDDDLRGDVVFHGVNDDGDERDVPAEVVAQLLEVARAMPA